MDDPFKKIREMNYHHKNFPEILQMGVWLENNITELVQIQTAIKKSLKLNKWIIEDDEIPITFKIRILRFSNAIDEDTLSDLLTLFKIRNIYAHNQVGSLKFEKVSGYLNQIKLKKVKDMPNNQAKFDKTYGHYILLLFRKAQRGRQLLIKRGIKFKIKEH